MGLQGHRVYAPQPHDIPPQPSPDRLERLPATLGHWPNAPPPMPHPCGSPHPHQSDLPQHAILAQSILHWPTAGIQTPPTGGNSYAPAPPAKARFAQSTPTIAGSPKHFPSALRSVNPICQNHKAASSHSALWSSYRYWPRHCSYGQIGNSS